MSIDIETIGSGFTFNGTIDNNGDVSGDWIDTIGAGIYSGNRTTSPSMDCDGPAGGGGSEPGGTARGSVEFASTSWGTHTLNPTNLDPLPVELLGLHIYSFHNYPQAPIPNFDVLDISFYVVDANNDGLFQELAGLQFAYHNTGADPGSLVTPEVYSYELDCDPMLDQCGDITFDFTTRTISLNAVLIPVMENAPDNAAGTGDSVTATGQFFW
jgi:hypothetical protein